MKKAIFLFLATLILLCGCSTSENETGSTDFNYTFTDGNGETVILSEKPEKIAILFSSYADIWKSAGGTVDITVGESVERGFAEESSVIVDENAGHNSINMEILISEQPDIVIGTTDYECQNETVEFCRSNGIPAAAFKVETFSNYLDVLKIFCDITGRYDLYKKNGTDVKERIDRLLSSNKDVASGKKILFIRAGSTAKSTKAKNTSQHFVCEMLRELGAVNIADSKSDLLDNLSLETILIEQPDCIFISLMGNPGSSQNYVEELFTTPGWKDLECIKKGNYFFLPKELFHFKPNSKWDEAYEYLIDLFKKGTDY